LYGDFLPVKSALTGRNSDVNFCSFTSFPHQYARVDTVAWFQAAMNAAISTFGVKPVKVDIYGPYPEYSSSSYPGCGKFNTFQRSLHEL
jgi:hypothetical protein